MLLSAAEQKVIVACMRWAAMEHDKRATAFHAQGKRAEAAQAAAFSQEAARLADKLQKG